MASWSDLGPEPWRWRVDLGLLLLGGDWLLLGVLLGGPFWLIEVARMSSSVQNWVIFCVIYHPTILTLASVDMPAGVSEGAGRGSTA